MTDEKSREEQLREVPFRKANPSTWPPGVREIGIGELNALGVDAEGHLYWHGKLVEVKRPLTLSIWQKAGAFIVSFSTFAMAVIEGLRYLDICPVVYCN